MISKLLGIVTTVIIVFGMLLFLIPTIAIVVGVLGKLFTI